MKPRRKVDPDSDVVDPYYMEELALAIIAAQGRVKSMDEAMAIAEKHISLNTDAETSRARQDLAGFLVRCSEQSYMSFSYPIRQMPPFTPSHWALEMPAAGGRWMAVEAMAAALDPQSQAVTVYRDEDNRWWILPWLVFNDDRPETRRFQRMTELEIVEYMNA